MNAQEIIDVIKIACKENRVCKARLANEPGLRFFNPFGVCLNSKRELVIVCIHSEGGCEPGKAPQLKILRVDDCLEIEMLDQTFDIDSGFNSELLLQNDVWVFHNGQH